MQVSAPDILAYIHSVYPQHEHERLTRDREHLLVYFADWLWMLHHGRTMTNSDWYRADQGPTSNCLHDQNRGDASALTPMQRAQIDRLVRKTAHMSTHHFLRTVAGTLPMIVCAEGYMDLADCARQWHEAHAPVS